MVWDYVWFPFLIPSRGKGCGPAVPQAAALVETGGVGNPVTPPGMTTSRKRNNNDIPDRQH